MNTSAPIYDFVASIKEDIDNHDEFLERASDVYRASQHTLFLENYEFIRQFDEEYDGDDKAELIPEDTRYRLKVLLARTNRK